MAPELAGRLIDGAVAAIRDNVEELTRLDQAIGDGDHGLNMKRGFEAVAAARDELAAATLSQLLQKAGMTLVMKVGGASGPLYGSLFMAMAKGLDGDPAGLPQVLAMLAEGIEAVKKRGRSDVGEKTMLDVLVPVRDALARGGDEGLPVADLLAHVRAAAAGGLAATGPMRATKGRASFLGERSVGHLDPGARSSQLLVGAVCDAIASTRAQSAGGTA